MANLFDKEQQEQKERDEWKAEALKYAEINPDQLTITAEQHEKYCRYVMRKSGQEIMKNIEKELRGEG